MLSLKNLQHDVPLAPLTTYKIGGPAKLFVEVATKEELVEAVLEARKSGTPYFILGTGANILIGDKGFEGLVIHNLARNFTLKQTSMVAESGTRLGDLIVFGIHMSLSGLEHFAGIPSSVGGAIWQNLHFLSPDRKSTVFIGDTVESALILDQADEIRRVDRDFFEFGYDDSILHHQEVIVLEVTFELTRGNPRQMHTQYIENIKWRQQRQPQLDQFPSCGSVFRKIDGVGAGRLIDHAGFKGRRIGNAQVSEKHANYIVNLGNARASDVRKLINIIQVEVFADSGHRLEPEIGFVGEF
jgi:UDP-N-acetylmuramate dehydrogenase